MEALDLVRLTPLMHRSAGRPEIVIGLIDGPVAVDHPDLETRSVRAIAKRPGACQGPSSTSCAHGTFVAGILTGRRGTGAPAICPGCTLLLRPIFADAVTVNSHMPTASPGELADAIVESVDAGARVINLSSALVRPSLEGEVRLNEALGYAAHHAVIIVAAAGNQGAVGSSVMTRHPWVIPVTACDNQGRPLDVSNLGSSIGKRGLSAPGKNINSLGTNAKSQTYSGTSAAAPFVTGSIALLWSEFPGAGPAEIKNALTQTGAPKRGTIVPPLLDASAAYHAIASAYQRRQLR